MNSGVYYRRTEAVKRVLWGAMILIGLGLLVLLYSLKTVAQSARKDVLALETEIKTEESQIQLLKAEIVYLERPDRLKELAGQTLGLKPENFKPQNDLELIRNIPFRAKPKLGGGSRP